MINSTDKISTRVSCSIVVIFIVFSQVDVILSNYDINWYGSLMFLDSANLTFMFSKGSNSVAN